MALQIKRGTNTQRLALTLLAAEPFFVTNYVAAGVSPFWIGDGTTPGGVAVMPTQFDELTDVEDAAAPIANNSFVQYDAAVDLWKRNTAITVDGTATFNNTAVAVSNDLNTVLARPLIVKHLYPKQFAYDNIQRHGVNNYISVQIAGTLAADLVTGTRFRFTALPASYSGSLSTATDYFMIRITNSIFYIASSLANAQAGTGIVLQPGNLATAPAGAQIDPYNSDLEAGVAFNLENRGGDAEYIAAAIDAGKVSDTDGRLKFFVRNDGALPATPQMTIDGDGNVTAAGNVTVSGTLTANNIAGNPVFSSMTLSGALAVNSTTNAVSTTTGSIVTAGGIGVARDIVAGEDIIVAGTVDINSTTQSNGPTSGALTVAGGVGIERILNVGGDVRVDSTTASTSTSSGALRVLGGAGIGGALFADSAAIANNLTVGGNLVVNGSTTTINSTTLTVDDKNIELASTASPTDALADGGGITLRGTTDKTILWLDATDSWTFNQAIASSNGARLGNVTVGQASDQTISTASGNLILASNSNTITTSAIIDSSNYIESGVVRIGSGVSGDTVTTTAGNLKLGAAGTNAVELLNTLNAGAVNITGAVNLSGTVSSDLIFNDGGTTQRGIRGTAGGNDYWFVGGDATGSDSAQLILATGDNGSEPVVVRQYTGLVLDANSNYRELVLLDSSGNTTLPGNLNSLGTINTAGTEFVINYDHAGVPTDNGQIRIERGTSSDAVLRWNETTDRWQYGTDASLLSMPDQAVDTSSSPTFAGLTVAGDSINLAQNTVLGYSENNNRLNRPTVRSSTGTVSGFRVSAPVATASAIAVISAFNTNDLNNGKSVNLIASNGATDPYRIQISTVTGGTIGSAGDSLAFYDNQTRFATVNPAGPTNSTDLVTKSYLESGASELAEVKLDSVAVLNTATLTTTTTAANQVLDSNSAATYRSAKYQVQIASATDYQAMEILLIHNGTTAAITVYADIKTGSTDLATFGADVSGGNFRLLTTPTNAATTYKVTKTLITV
ncbi:hypothetical protein UFOVP700_17 [uncultured Caudovirales phage]|uniref:Uncharacterized protein n=1 Tax=uncultured Caudovirales phage TaxID=2100421 RepID=A0A6J5NHW6_9CAUD|nr:hypothetical protein UFOVP700_17 [uncultured Caudovirales phage]